MYAQVEKSKENKSRTVANSVAQKKSNVKQGFGFVDNRSEVASEIKNYKGHQQVLAPSSASLLSFPTPQTTIQEPVIQGAFKFRNFDESVEKFYDLYNGLVGTENPYLNYLHRKGIVVVNLDGDADENPGDATVFIQTTDGGKWVYRTISQIREMDTIFGIGAVVNIRKWYYDKYPSGKILSMLAHEVGVHIVPYMDEMMNKLLGAKQQKVDTTKEHGPRGATDHLRVATVDHEDFWLYRDVVNDIENLGQARTKIGANQNT